PPCPPLFPYTTLFRSLARPGDLPFDDQPSMRPLVLLALLALASPGLVACSQSYASRVDDRTFRIEGPEVPGGSDAPNRRLADKLDRKSTRLNSSHDQT